MQHQEVDTVENLKALAAKDPTAQTDILAVINSRIQSCRVKLQVDNGNFSLEISGADEQDEWLRLAKQLAGGVTFRICEVCDKPFGVGGRLKGAKRPDSKACSPSCRQKQYVQRKEQALILLAQGKSPKEVSAATGYELASVHALSHRLTK